MVSPCAVYLPLRVAGFRMGLLNESRHGSEYLAPVPPDLHEHVCYLERTVASP